jgi:hypothetical protein
VVQARVKKKGTGGGELSFKGDSDRRPAHTGVFIHCLIK